MWGQGGYTEGSQLALAVVGAWAASDACLPASGQPPGLCRSRDILTVPAGPGEGRDGSGPERVAQGLVSLSLPTPTYSPRLNSVFVMQW